MYRIKSAIAILIATIVIITVGFTINTNTARSVYSKVDAAQQYNKNGNVYKAKQEILSARDEWENKMETMLMFMSHSKLDQIEEALGIANTYIDCGDKNAFSAECQKATILLQHFYDLEYPTINNIL